MWTSSARDGSAGMTLQRIEAPFAPLPVRGFLARSAVRSVDSHGHTKSTAHGRVNSTPGRRVVKIDSRNAYVVAAYSLARFVGIKFRSSRHDQAPAGWTKNRSPPIYPSAEFTFPISGTRPVAVQENLESRSEDRARSSRPSAFRQSSRMESLFSIAWRSASPWSASRPGARSQRSGSSGCFPRPEGQFRSGRYAPKPTAKSLPRPSSHHLPRTTLRAERANRARVR
jgi:hypothetical protein